MFSGTVNNSTDRLLLATPFSATIQPNFYNSAERSDEEKAGIFSKLTLSWLSRVLSIGYKRTLNFEDIGPLSIRHRSPRLPPARAHNDDLERRLFRFAVSRGFLANAFLLLVADLSTYMTPILQSALLALVELRAGGATLLPEDYMKGIALCVGMFVLQCINTFSINLYFKRSMMLGMEIRAAIQAEVYDKLLVMDEAHPGQLVNLVINDASRVDLAIPFLHYWWSNPMQCILVAVLLYGYVYSAGIFGVMILIVFVPLQSLGATVMSTKRRQAARHTDNRLRLFQEILAGIKTVKLKAWEQLFLDELAVIRKAEQKDLISAQYIRALISMMSVTLPLLAFLVTMILYHVVMDYPMSQSITVTVIAYFSLLRQPLSLMPAVAASTSDARAALHRLSAFLGAAPTPRQRRKSSNSAVDITDSVFRWKDNANALVVDSLKIARGQLVVITGPVGCGKTSLLMAILGEMPASKGHVAVDCHSMPLACQTPLILNMTIKENIVFTSDLQENLYGRCLDICQLREDIDRLPEQDATMIGEKGANLSGGQKTRISLARACYHSLVNSNCTLLLDDPLASVDAQVCKSLANECILKGLDSITRIIVTNNPVLIKQADQIVSIDSKGYVTTSQYDQSASEQRGPWAQPEDTDQHADDAGSESPFLVHTPPIKPASALSYSDARDIGSIQNRVLRRYIEMAGGLWFLVPVLLLASAQQATRTLSDITASQWAYVKEASHSSWYISVFTAYLVAHGASFFTNATFFIRGGRVAGYTLHAEALSQILCSPLTWISHQSPGRLTNRLSADLETVDYALPESLRSSLVLFANVAAALLLLAYHKWYNLLPISALCVVLLLTVKYYRASSREMGRLTAIAKGPLQGHFVESAHGLVTLRAFKSQTAFRRRAHVLIDECSRSYYVQISLQRWLELRVTMSGNVLILLAALSTLLVPGPLALTSATMNKTLTVTRAMNWLIRRATDAELLFISVERLVQLGSETAREPVLSSDPRPSVPQATEMGMKVEFRNVSAQYTQYVDNGVNSARALHNMSFTVNPGERIGIVGRTGSGKSTLILALFHAITPLPPSLILLDDLPTAAMPLPALRSLIGVIPQEAFLFTATLRRNLDPHAGHPDDALHAALAATGLLPLVVALPAGLDTVLKPTDLSAGHRQLLALTRILLAPPRLLVMDEATAALDHHLEERVMDILSGPLLKRCTVLSVAHRFNAVKNCDRVIVLDKGWIVEEGVPGDLLSNPNSRFAQLT